AESCLRLYSPESIADQPFAFDGTVASVGPAVTDSTGHGRMKYVGTTFVVHEWFGGGTGATVTVDMPPPTSTSARPGGASTQLSGEMPPTYEIGSRLLVSGAPRWGGAPLADPIAWGCGFTRYYDAPTATAWRAATKQS